MAHRSGQDNEHGERQVQGVDDDEGEFDDQLPDPTGGLPYDISIPELEVDG